MAKDKPKQSRRVIALSVLIAVVIVVAIWLLFGGVFGGGGASMPEQVASTGTAPGTAGGELPVTTDTPAAPAAEDLLQAGEAIPGAVDPSGAELQPGQLPLMHAKLEALTAAAAERAEAGTMSLKLYLVVPTVEVLVPVNRQTEAPPTLESQVQRGVEELIAWSGGEMVSPLPAETIVREVWVSPGGVAFIDFDISLPEALVGGSLEEIHAVYGVVATVTSSFPEIRAVQILVGGEEAETLDGHVDVSRPLLPQYDMVLTNPRLR
jgi:hypothetical protein